MRLEGDRSGSHPSQIPRPLASSSARPPIQLSAPPRAQQYRAGPGNPYGRQPAPRHHDRSVNGSGASFTSSHRPAYSSRQGSDHQPPPRSYQPAGRHLSHISALTNSRPVSEAFVVSPALPSAAVSEMGEEEEYNSKSTTHSRAGSQGRRTRTTTPVRSRKNSAPMPIRDSETLPPSDQAATMEALTAAIRQGLTTTAASSRSATPKPFSEVRSPQSAQSVRMPFQGEPESPSSIYTDFTATNKRSSVPMSSFQGYDPHDLKQHTIVEQEANDYEDSHYTRDIPTPMSTHPIMAGERAGMSSKIPAARRPLRLDMGAVREAEARGSMTSLSDLIARATKLASNLDRGRTASRLGHLDMFGSSDKLGNVRNSTYSDVLDAFPAAGTGTNTPRGGRPNTLWPNGEKQYMASKSSLGRYIDNNDGEERPKRKCCGLSPVVFVVVLIIVILLVAAAVLVPVFLLVLPKQHKSADLANCHSTRACQNGGYSVSTDNVCSCICVDGFTGADCSNQNDPECVTATMSDGSTTYNNATTGSSVLPLLRNAEESFNIPLNKSRILSQFAYNNLSCASENSLVDFGKGQASAKVKRFVIVPGMMSTEPHVPVLNLPPSESKRHPRFVIVDGLDDNVEEPYMLPTHTLSPRQDATQSANGIVFATSGGAASPTATATGTDSSPAVSTSASSTTSSQTSKINATDNQLDFAATVVLYVLQTSSEINNAVTANQAILTFFQESNPTNSTVEVVDGKQVMQADFDKLQLTFTNGTIVGGSGGTSNSS